MLSGNKVSDEGILFLGILDNCNNPPMKACFHSLVSNLTTVRSNLGVYENSPGDTLTIMKWFHLTKKVCVNGIYFLVSMSLWKNFHSETFCQCALSNPPTGCSTLVFLKLHQATLEQFHPWNR